jgi:hypothetical protein
MKRLLTESEIDYVIDFIKINKSIPIETAKSIISITKKKLKRNLGIVEHKTNTATEMIDDYKEIYNERYLRNWAMGISIVSGFLVIKWIFNTKTQGV